MGVTHEAGLSPQDPCGGSPAGWSRSAQVPQGNQRGACPAAPSGTETGHCRAAGRAEAEADSAQKGSAAQTAGMTEFMDDLRLGSPQHRDSPERRGSRRSCSGSSRSSSRSSRSSSSSSSSGRSSRSWSRSRSRSRSRRRRSRRSRRRSRSYSRSRSRSRGSRRYRGSRGSRYRPRRYRHRYGRRRSRSWSRGRPCYRRSYSRSRSRSRGRRYYGFGRTVYPEAYRGWRSRSRTRSRSHSPLHLSEKDKRELLEIAKANAAKALGTDNIVLPASLKISAPAKEIKTEKQEREEPTESAEQPGSAAEDVSKAGMERATIQRSISFSPNNTMAKPVLQKPVSHTVVKEPVVSPPREDDRKGSPYGQWVPVKKEEKKTFLNFSPKSSLFRAR
ncbi:arginine/serine-rich protein 1 [Melospiza melodia melodia]|uniref:arginine/serine-rich protein 1 n=1 Tax=Melospiza melodia melodia TaxID=1914991 RepID=UPI002FD24788